jgi:hypothetical protein
MDESGPRAHGLNREPILDPTQVVPERDASPEGDRNDHRVHEVDQVGLKEPPHRRRSPADANVSALRSLPGQLQHFGRSSAYEAEAGPVVELDGRARVVRQHEDRCPERWLIAPPSSPSVVSPRTLLRTGNFRRPMISAPMP